MGLKWERSYPYAGTIVACAGAFLFRFNFPAAVEPATGRVIEPVLTNGITVASIVLTLLTVALGLIPALDNPVMAAIRKTSYFGLLNSYLREGIWSCLLFVAIGMAGFWWATAPWFPPIWFTTAALGAFTFIRVTSTMFIIAGRQPAPKP